MTALDDAILEAAAGGLHELVLRESVGGWQVVVKVHGALRGPWGVGCDTDPVKAIRAALGASAVSGVANDTDIFG